MNDEYPEDDGRPIEEYPEHPDYQFPVDDWWNYG